MLACATACGMRRQDLGSEEGACTHFASLSDGSCRTYRNCSRLYTSQELTSSGRNATICARDPEAPDDDFGAMITVRLCTHKTMQDAGGG